MSDLDSSISLSDLLEDLNLILGRRHKRKFLRETVIELLETDHSLLWDEEGGLAIKRGFLYMDREFLIALSARERKGRYLIPGHRFIPYASRYLPPHTLVLRHKNDCKLQMKKIQITLSELRVYYSMVAETTMIQWLCLDDPRNIEILLDGPAPDKVVFVSVWKLADIADMVPEGGFLVTTMKNWEKGVFDFYVTGPDPSAEYQQRLENWCAALEIGLKDSFKVLGPNVEIYDQLNYATYFGPVEATWAPPIHFGGFISRLKTIKFTTFHGIPIFWDNDDSLDKIQLEYLQPKAILKGYRQNINEIFYDIGLPFHEYELEAFMRDALFKGKKLEDALARAFAGRTPLKFANPKQEKSLNRMIKILWMGLSKSYNRFLDQLNGKVRSEFLVLYEQLNAWLCMLDKENIGLERLDPDDYIPLSSMVTFLSHTLTALNHDAEIVTTDQVAHLNESISAIKQQLDDLIKNAHDQLFPAKNVPKPAAPKPVFRVIQGGKDD